MITSITPKSGFFDPWVEAKKQCSSIKECGGIVRVGRNTKGTIWRYDLVKGHTPKADDRPGIQTLLKTNWESCK